MKRADLTQKILDVKREKGWTWKYLCAEIDGFSPMLITAALLGQMKLTEPQAEATTKLFGLTKAEQALLNEVPYRGSLPTVPPTRSADLSFLRVGHSLWRHMEGTDPGGIRRRHHVGD